jgi:uncharacterized membrane protein
VISRYLDSLSAELLVPRRARARILAETRDHLLEAVSCGQSESEAVEAFGLASDVAARFHEQLATSSARRASARTVLLMGLFVVAMTLAAFGPSNAFPFGIPVFIGAQLAAVSGAITFARWLRYRREVLIPAARLPDVHRACALTVGTVAVVGVAELANGIGAGKPAFTLGGSVLVAAALAASLEVRRAGARTRVVPASPAGPEEDAVDDLIAVASRYAPRLVSEARRLPLAGGWLDLRRHPWRFCTLFALACGVALAGWHGVVEGGPPTPASLARALLAAMVIASIEGVAVIACFAAFGRYLGIRR